MQLEELKDRTFHHLCKFEDVKTKICSLKDVELSRGLSLELEKHFNEARSHLLAVNNELMKRHEENGHVIRQLLELEKKYEDCRVVLERVSLPEEQGSLQDSQGEGDRSQRLPDSPSSEFSLSGEQGSLQNSQGEEERSQRLTDSPSSEFSLSGEQGSL